MSKKSLINRVYLTLALGLLFAAPASLAQALSVEWKSLPERERVVIRLNASDGVIRTVERSSATGILISFSTGTQSFNMAAPDAAQLFAGIEAAPGGLKVSLNGPEFGFIVTRPANDLVHLDIYPDSLGSRWRPDAAKSREPVRQGDSPEKAPAKTPVKTPVKAPEKTPVTTPNLPPSGKSPQKVTPQPQIDPTPPQATQKSEPSSVFSGKIEPPGQQPAQQPVQSVQPVQGGQTQPGGGLSQPLTETPAPSGGKAQNPASAGGSLGNGPAATPTVPPTRLPESGKITRPLNDGDNYKLPEWPPLEMPPSLPAPPPPPPSGAGAQNEPAYLPARSLSWRDFLPFASTAHAATVTGAPNADNDYRVVEAPFAYRARLNVENAADWVEQPIPVLIRVPESMIFDVRADSVPPPGTESAPATPAAPLAPPPAQPGSSSPGPAAPTQAVPAPPAQVQSPEPAPAPPPTAISPQAPEQPLQAVPAPPPSTGAPEGPVVYVDEQGNVVEAPLEPDPALRDADRKIAEGNHAEAILVLDRLLMQHNLSRAQREMALHRKADAVFALYENDLANNYQAVVDSSTRAVNFNTRSPRNSAAYLRLGYTNLMAGNAYEAAGFFNVLRREYPNYENIPLTYYYWGDYQYSQGQLNEAAEQFNYIVNNYPEHPISRDAALGLSRAYYRMGYFEDAFKIMLFVEQRWPSFYLDYPPMLSMMGDVAYRVGNLDKARSAYWLYYNLTPQAEDSDMVLTRLGDIYSAGKFDSAAVQVYREAVDRFPSKDGGIISLMRMAEDGIYDDPTVSDMFRVFERPYDQRPAEAYRLIIREYPGSPLVTLAKLKLAMWMLWQKDYLTVLDLCSEIVSEAPNSPLASRSREVAMNAFTLLAAEDSNDKRYNRAREVWDRYAILQTQAEFLTPESRLALAVSQWNTGSSSSALATLEPFFYGAKAGEVSEMAIFLALNIMVENYRWEKIDELARRVELWELTPQAQNQLDYALALSYENMDKLEAAVPLWSRVYSAKLLPPTQMANAAFYLARSSERQRDLETAYYVGQDALRQLKIAMDNDPEHADIEKIKTQLMSLVDIAETSGVLPQALEYAQEYMQYVNEGSLDQQSVAYRMARIHKKRGDTAEWLRILEDMVAKHPNSVFGKTAKSEISAYRLGNDAARFSGTTF